MLGDLEEGHCTRAGCNGKIASMLWVEVKIKDSIWEWQSLNEGSSMTLAEENSLNSKRCYWVFDLQSIIIGIELPKLHTSRFLLLDFSVLVLRLRKKISADHEVITKLGTEF